jgi:ADP-heptose:LPS heptosyltransferase
MNLFKKRVLKCIAFIGNITGCLFNRKCRLGALRKVLIFQAGGIGDILRTFPMIQSIHNRYPEADIFVLCPIPEMVFRLFPERHIITEYFPYDVSGEHKGFNGKWRLIRKLRREKFDLIVSPARGEGMLENTIISFLIGADCRAGFDKNGAGFLNNVKVELKADKPIVIQNLDILKALTIKPAVENITLEIPHKDIVFGKRFRESNCHPEEHLISMHLGSHWREHLRWPVARYIDLTSKILNNYKGIIVLLGTNIETELTNVFLREIGNDRIINLVEKTTLTQAAAILKYSDLFIGNDSGLLHISTALKVPSVGIFGYTSPNQVISATQGFMAVHKGINSILYHHQPFFQFQKKNPIELIEVKDVFSAVKTLMKKSDQQFESM